MAKYVPHYEDFKSLETWRKFALSLFYMNTLLPILILVIPNTDNYSIFRNIVIVVTFISLILYSILDVYIEYFIVPGVEEKRKADFLDNAFGTHILSRNSVDYYTNDNIGIGIYKAAVNLFENSLFTFRVSKAMLPKKIIPLVLVLAVVIILAIFGWKDQPIALPALQLLFSTVVAVDFIKYIILHNKSKAIYEGWNNLFRTTNINEDHVSQIPEIMRYWLIYESMLSRLQVPLDVPVFQSLNEELSLEWEEIKSNLHIK
ncbi:hypothetical protein [Spirosoma sordidisoli]|uniref:Uncharacterized protein n=1 Tax=Spirosoma sordidisoli TaxID=2502893 RepID=A0A4Q2UW23_9BACT|nr:hypothetical protein [Spirosoma sordidisoli]RYC72050.1 hypothetical protein EQG79_08000 [Spirosoma sordidisoli]